MGQQHDFYLVQTGNLVPRSASWRGFLACFQQPSPLRSANLDSSGIEAKSAKQIFQRPHILNPLIARIPAGVDPAFGPSAPTVRANPIDEVMRRG